MNTKNELWFVSLVCDPHGRYPDKAIDEFDDYEDAISEALFYRDENYYNLFGPIGIAEEESDETFIKIISSDPRNRKTAEVTKDGNLSEYIRRQ